MPPKFRAELVEGVVIVPGPLGCPHGQAQGRILLWIGQYVVMTPGTTFFDHTTTILDEDNEYRPDAQLLIRPEFGREGARIANYVYGAPQLAIEVAASSEAYDLHEKFAVYERTGVREYLVALVREQEVRWFTALDGKFAPITAEAGVLKSRVFPGLWLEAAALFAEDPGGLLVTLQAGLADAEHATFVQDLAAAGRRQEPRT